MRPIYGKVQTFTDKTLYGSKLSVDSKWTAQGIGHRIRGYGMLNQESKNHKKIRKILDYFKLQPTNNS